MNKIKNFKNRIFSLNVKLSLFFVLLLGLTTPVFGAPNDTQGQKTVELQWYTDFEKAKALSKKESKPIFLYFTGSDWCGWCMKLNKEVLTTSDFIDLVGDKFIFVKADFPLDLETQDSRLRKQNEALKTKYDISGYPTILILSPEQHVLATLNYREGGGKEYAEYLLKVMQEHKDFKNGISSLESQNTKQLERLYKQAVALQMDETAHQIIQVGIQKNESPYFLKEHYWHLLNEGKLQDLETIKVRAMLLSMDTQNRQGIAYDVAIFDFACLCETLPKAASADELVQPLKEYLSQFGGSDKERAWRLEMMVSQVYRSKNQMQKARAYAKAAYEHAPYKMKVSINEALQELDSSK